MTKLYSNAQSGGRNAALVAIDPRSGEIRVWIGSADYTIQCGGEVQRGDGFASAGIDVQTNLHFAEALQPAAHHTATILRDEPTDFGGSCAPQL